MKAALQGAISAQLCKKTAVSISHTVDVRKMLVLMLSPQHSVSGGERSGCSKSHSCKGQKKCFGLFACLKTKC